MKKLLVLLFLCFTKLVLAFDYSANCKNFEILNAIDEKIFINDYKELLGGKASNLVFLQKQADINVPSWFCLMSLVFDENIKKNNEFCQLILNLESLRENFDINDSLKIRQDLEKKMYIIAKELRDSILNISISKDLTNEIKNQLNILNPKLKRKAYVVRSSASIEDSAESSFAGLFESYLNLYEIDEILEAIKLCWASSYNDRVIEHCLYNNIDINDISMAVVIQEMIDANVSGTGFNFDVSTNSPVINIIGNWGIGGIVEGETSGDSYIINPDNMMIIKTILGDKKKYNRLKEKSGLVKTKTPYELRKKFSLNSSEAKQVAINIDKIGEFFKNNYGYKFVDVEFAFDKDKNLFIVQTRPLIMKGKKASISLKKQKEMKLLASGKYSIFGIAFGRVKIVENFEDLESGKVVIEEDDILVAHRSTNYFTPYLTKFKGIVTIEGTPTSHPMLIARERNIPCVIGVFNALEVLKPYDGQYITIDGGKKAIYLGVINEEDLVYEDISPIVEIVPLEEKPNDDLIIPDLLMRNRLLKDDDGYWLVNPKSKLSKPLLEIQENSHYKRIELINLARRGSHIDANIEIRIYDDKVYANFEPMKEQVKMYAGMSIDDCERFVEGYHNTILEYQEISSRINNDPSLFRQYVEITEKFYAYMWQSYLFKIHVNTQTAKLANKLKIPKIFYEEYCSYVQSRFVEEDIELKKDAKILSKILKNECNQENIDFKNISVDQIKNNFREFYQELITYAKKYKFSKSEDFSGSLPLNQALKVIKSIPHDYKPGFMNCDSETDYFIENKELKRWIKLGVLAKALHNNAHHYRMRGVWIFRDFLKKAEQKLLERQKIEENVDMLHLSCDEIDDLLDNL